MDGKIILLLLSVVAVGMFVLPSTLALYTGSHAFVNGSSVDCGKCHVASMDNIAAELNTSSRPHTTMTCGNCHGSTNPDVSLAPGNVHGHAASMSVDCIGCHANASESVDDEDVLRELNLATAAHHEVTWNASAENEGITDRDQACIACHTDVPVNITDASLDTISGTIWIKGNSTNLWTAENWTSE